MSSTDATAQVDEIAFRRRRTHAQIEAMTGLILQAVGYPSKRHRDFICALQSVNSGTEAKVPYTPFRRAHLTLADYMQLHGSSDTRRKAVYRETVVLRAFQRRTGILLFHVTPGREDEATTYIDYLTPAADLAMQRALSSPLWKTDKQAAKREAVQWAVEQLPRIEVEEEDPEGGAPLPLDAYTAAQEARLCRNVETVADEIEKRGGDDDLWLERHIKQLLSIKASRKKTAPARRDMASLRLVQEREAKDGQPAEPERAAEGSGNKTTWDSSVRPPHADVEPNEEEPVGVRTFLSVPPSLPLQVEPGEVALSYARRGWAVFPLHNPDKNGVCSCSKGVNCDPTNIGKHPRTKNGLTDATTDERQVRAWWRKWPRANVGLAMGKSSGLVALDVDPRAGGDASLAELFDEHGAFPETLEAITGGGGFHFVFSHPGVKFKNSTSKIAEGLDVKTDGGYLVAAPSVHASGKRYEWRGEREPSPMPAWLLTLILTESAKPQRAGTAAASRRAALSASGSGAQIAYGDRNKRLFRIACAHRGNGATLEEIEAAVAEAYETRCEKQPPMGPDEFRKIALSAMRYQPESKKRAARAQGATP